MINQILFFLLLYALGLLVVLRFRITSAPYFSFLSAFIWGALGWVVVIWLLSILSIPISMLSIVFFLLIVFSGLFVSNIKSYKFMVTIQERTALVLSLIVTLFLIVLFSAYNFSYASPDTFFNILAGRSFAALGWAVNPSHYVIWGPYLPFIQVASDLFNLEYIYGFNPVMFFVFLISLFTLFRYAYKVSFQDYESTISISIGNLKTGIRLEVIFSILALLLIASTRYAQQFIGYIHSNWITGIYFTIFIISIWLALRTKQENWLPIITLSSLALTLCRVESVFYIAVPLFILIHNSELSFRKLQIWLAPVMLLNVFWSFQKLRHGYQLDGNKGSDVFLYGTILFFVIMLVLLFIIPLIRKWNLLWNFMILLGFGGLFILALIWRPEILLTTIKVTYLNLTDVNNWNLVWVFLPPFLALAFITKPDQHEEIFQITIITYFILLLVFAPIRGAAYRVGWFDSGNRMMLHIYPILVFYVLNKIGLLVIRRR